MIGTRRGEGPAHSSRCRVRVWVQTRQQPGWVGCPAWGEEQHPKAGRWQVGVAASTRGQPVSGLALEFGRNPEKSAQGHEGGSSSLGTAEGFSHPVLRSPGSEGSFK